MSNRRPPVLVVLSLCVATPLLWLACSDSSNEEPAKPPPLPGYVRACGPMQPCGSAYECLGHICVPRGDGGGADSASADGGSAGLDAGLQESFAFGPYMAQLSRVNYAPCASAQGLAYWGGYLWCGDNASKTFKRFVPGNSASQGDCKFGTTASVVDMAYDASTNRLLALMSNFEVRQITLGGTAQKISTFSGRHALAAWSGQVLSFASTTVYRHSSENLQQYDSSPLGSQCGSATTNSQHLFRYCSTKGTSPRRHSISIHAMGFDSVTSIGNFDLLVDLQQVNGMVAVDVSPKKLYLLGANGSSKGSVAEFFLLQ